MPAWVQAGYRDYARRLPRDCALNLVEIDAGRRARRTEGERMLQALPAGARVIALEVGGRPWSTEELAAQLAGWLRSGRDVALLVGGPEGLDPGCRAAAAEQWSLSPLTFPHPLVRVVVAEQLYRAWTVLNHHPYHRA